MLTDIDKEMMTRFLEKNYPIKRIKHNMRFRRGILFDDGREYILGDESQHTALRFKLIEAIKLIFYCDDRISREVVNNFLKSK
jgi:hypothetical protein